MSSVVSVTVHSSQFPDQVRRDLVESLRTRRVNHKFHYDSVKQTQKWLALHEACSPARTDPDCLATYDRAFESVVSRVSTARVHVIGLGAGGGQKDTRLLERLAAAGHEVAYSPVDVGTAMVLVARQAALSVVPPQLCFPAVCDLATTPDLGQLLDEQPVPKASRLVTFFGMLPNFEPGLILPLLASVIRPQDHLLLSANLAPGDDYLAGVQRVLPLYDNALTRDWLMTFLVDLGIEAGDGELRFGIQEADPGLKRIQADFRFRRPRSIALDNRRFDFSTHEDIRLFFSYRHTPAMVRSLCAEQGLDLGEGCITQSGEEGVFLAQR